MSTLATKKYLDSPTLIELNSKAVNARYNRSLSGQMLDRLDPDGLHLEILTIPHNDDHLRMFLMLKARGTMVPIETFLDMSFEDYAELPDVSPQMLLDGDVVEET